MALRWVQENVAAFGGDHKQVNYFLVASLQKQSKPAEHTQGLYFTRNFCMSFRIELLIMDIANIKTQQK